MKNLLLAAIFALTTATAFAQPCSNLFISEYVEGSSFNKAVEIYNPTSNTVDLSNYRLILRGFNGSGNLFPPDTLQLSGSLAPSATYVVANVDADANLLALADLTDDDNINFNGNDAIAIYDVSLGQVIDAVGDYTATTDPPNSEWPVYMGSTLNNTLIRKASVNQGTTSWATGANQWDALPVNTFSGLGAHNMNPCGPITDTLVNFSPNAANVAEEIGTYDLTVQLITPGNFSVDVELKSGDAAQLGNFTTQTVTFSGTSNESISLTIVDDAIQEPAEVFEFRLTNPSANLVLGADTVFTLTINPSDQPLALDPLYDIATIRGNNAGGEPDSINVQCRVIGVVLGPNYSPGGLNFTVNDGTAGIGVFAPSSASNFNYTVSEGDSVMIQGEVDAYNGQGQLSFLDTIILLGTGTVPTPTEVTSLSEATESELVLARGLTVVSTISNTGAGVTYEVTNGLSTFEMRLDSDISFNQLPNRFDAIGIGGQFSFNSPYVIGYQIVPRKDSDITSSTGIEELSAGQVSVYPNPTMGNVVIEMNDASLDQVTITDLSGRVVLTESLTSSRQVLDISSLGNGMYLLQATGKGQVFNTRIVKQ